MGDAVIVAGVRTPIGVFGGSLRDIPAQDLAAHALKALLERVSFNPKDVDEVIFGCVVPPTEALNVARVASLKAGVPRTVPAKTVQRMCASGMQAVTDAVTAIWANRGKAFLVGGVESMSNTPYVLKGIRWGLKFRHAQLYDAMWESLTDPIANLLMGEIAERIARRYGISRREQDEYALASHQKAARATAKGRYRREIAPLLVQTKGGEQLLERDENIRFDASPEKLSRLRPVFASDGTITAGNSSALNDGAVALLVMDAEYAKALGLEPSVKIRSFAYAALAPDEFPIAPVPAAQKALEEAALTLSDIGILEVHEAFAAQVLAVEREMRWDRERVNVNGGTLALGHPLGMTGARLLLTLAIEMRQRQVPFGLAMVCAAGGMGGALVLELL